jgi:hypothetical protein
VQEDVGCAGVSRPALSPRSVTTEEAKRLGSTGPVKRPSKNDFTRHPTPRTTRPIRHGNTATISEMGPTIIVGSAKAQASKVKLVYGSEPPRATRAWDEATQRMANILTHPVPPSMGPDILKLRI